MNRLSRALVAAGLLGLAGACSGGDCTKPAKDMDPDRLARVVSSEVGGPSESHDLIVGTGRLANLDRRMSLQLSLSLVDGGKLGSGSIEVEYPRVELSGNSMRGRNSPNEARLFGAIAGMREGGTRQFTWRTSHQYPDECQPRGGSCQFSLGRDQVPYPPDQDILIEAHLDHLCAPTYCVERNLSIPPSSKYRLVEKSCR